MLWRFLPALAWVGILAIATWLLRDGLARRGMGKNAVASLLNFLVAVVLVLPLIRLDIEAANDGRAVAQWVSDIDQKGLRTPDWLPHLPYVGNTLVDWWQANLAAPGQITPPLGGCCRYYRGPNSAVTN